jgi:hypothetical protein
MKLWLKAIACLCLSTAVVTTVASATQVVYLTPQDLGRQSELVVRGRVLSVDSHWNDKHTKIFTVTRVAVDETYKGSPQSVVDLIQLGGTVGNIKVTVQGALQWTPGEEVLLFAEPYDGLTYQVSGLSQGKFAIRRDLRTGVVYVQAPSLEGVTLLGTPSPQAPARSQAAANVPLERFVNQALGRR